MLGVGEGTTQQWVGITKGGGFGIVLFRVLGVLGVLDSSPRAHFSA